MPRRRPPTGEVRRLRDEPLTDEQALAAACTVHAYDASRILDVRQAGKMNEVPDRAYFVGVFSFSSDQLLGYIKEHVGLAQQLLAKSGDQRASPSAYIEAAGDGYEVGWYHDGRSQIQFHDSIDHAAADFVLAYWKLPRLRP